MHPILAHRGRLLAYVAVLLAGGLVFAGLLVGSGLRWPMALALALPLFPVLGFLCLAAWFPARSTPLDRTHLWQALFTQLVAALLTSSLWQLSGGGWAWLLGRSERLSDAPAQFGRVPALFFAVGVLVYLLAAAASYVFVAARRSVEAERRALEARRERELAQQELELARGLQRRLLPRPERRGEGFRLAARNLAARGVAGDFYDHFVLDDGTLRIAVADVAGKGLAASLIMAAVKAVLPLVAEERSVTETLGELNRRLAAYLDRREFVALALAAVDPSTGRVELANAGLPDAYVLRSGGAVESVVAPQPRLPLGLREEVSYVAVEVTLHPGDRLLLLTDGLPEAVGESGDPLGYERLEELLDHDDESPARWIDRLLERVRRATGPQPEDDWTALLLERD